MKIKEIGVCLTKMCGIPFHLICLTNFSGHGYNNDILLAYLIWFFWTETENMCQVFLATSNISATLIFHAFSAMALFWLITLCSFGVFCIWGTHKTFAAFQVYSELSQNWSWLDRTVTQENIFSSSTALRLTKPLKSLPTSGVTTFLHVLCKIIPSKHLPSQEFLKNLALSFAEKFSELILRIKFEFLAVSSKKTQNF